MRGFFSDERVQFPSRGILRHADRLAVVAPIFVFAIGAMISIFAHGTVQAYALGIGLFVVVAVIYLTRYELIPRLKPKSPLYRLYERVPSGIAGLSLGVLAGATMLSIGPLGLPAELRLILWPIFLPGVILIARSRAQEDHKTIFGAVSTLTLFVVLYSGAAGFATLLPVRLELAGRIGDALHPHSWRELLDAALKGMSLFVPSIWTGATILLTYYLIRRVDVFRVQAALLFEINETFAGSEDFTKALPDVATLLQKYLLYERILIVVPDEHYYEVMQSRTLCTSDLDLETCLFRVAACAGEAVDVARDLTFPMSKGISNRALAHGEIQNVPDVLLDPDYVSVGLGDTRSELNVPVFGSVQRELLFANLIVHDRRPWAFTSADEAMLRQVRDYLSVYAQDPQRNPAPFHSALEVELDRLSDVSDSYAAMAAEVAESAKRLFGVTQATYVTLGLGSAVPLTRELHSQNGALADFVQGRGTAVQGTQVLHECVRSWEPCFLDWKALPEIDEWHQWLRSEELSALVILPVGAKSQRTGLLLLAFSQLPIVWPSTKAHLIAFCQAVSPQLCALWYSERMYQGFLKPTVDLHSLLAQAGLGRGRVTARLMDPALEPGVRSVLANVELVLQKAQVTQGAQVPDFAIVSFSTGLETFQGDLVQGHALRLNCDVDPRIDSESIELKTIIYRLVTEGIINSLFHGNAKTVGVKLSRLSCEVMVDIGDDGEGFDPCAKNLPKGGMHLLLNNLRQYCGSDEPDWSGTGRGVGTRLRLSIPLLSDASSSLPHSTDWTTGLDL